MLLAKYRTTAEFTNNTVGTVRLNGVIAWQLEAQDSKHAKTSFNVAFKGDSVYEFEIINN